MPYNVAVAGATGAVGRVMISVLEERNFPVNSIKLLSSHRSAGSKLSFRGEDVTVEEMKESSFEGIDVVLSSAGGSVSKWFAPHAVKAGAVVIDNTSAFRMDPDVPLVVPEVNPDEAFKHNGIIANPNCSTIQMVVALAPIHKAAKIRRIVVSTYQAVSGAGWKAVVELRDQSKAILSGEEYAPQVFPYPIAFNAIPQIPQKDAFLENGYSTEEMKMVNETRKIMGDNSIRVTATTVRVPVFYGHSESVNVETENKLTAEQVKDMLGDAPGVTLLDDLSSQIYPVPSDCEGKDDVFVGRIREDISCENGIDMWVVSDNVRKGAALNAVQIAELLFCSGS